MPASKNVFARKTSFFESFWNWCKKTICTKGISRLINGKSGTLRTSWHYFFFWTCKKKSVSLSISKGRGRNGPGSRSRLNFAKEKVTIGSWKSSVKKKNQIFEHAWTWKYEGQNNQPSKGEHRCFECICYLLRSQGETSTFTNRAVAKKKTKQNRHGYQECPKHFSVCTRDF